MNVITISRQYGAGGTELARMLAGRFGFRVIDNELLSMAAEQSGMDLAKIERVYEQRPTFQDLRVYKERSEKYVRPSTTCWNDLAQQGEVIIVGRGANLALLQRPNVFNLRMVADFAARVQRVQQREGLDETAARRTITEADYAREAYYRYLYNVMPDDPLAYDMILNTSRLTLDEAAAMVAAAFEAVRARPHAVRRVGRRSHGARGGSAERGARTDAVGARRDGAGAIRQAVAYGLALPRRRVATGLLWVAQPVLSLGSVYLVYLVVVIAVAASGAGARACSRPCWASWRRTSSSPRRS